MSAARTLLLAAEVLGACAGDTALSAQFVWWRAMEAARRWPLLPLGGWLVHSAARGDSACSEQAATAVFDLQPAFSLCAAPPRARSLAHRSRLKVCTACQALKADTRHLITFCSAEKLCPPRMRSFVAAVGAGAGTLAAVGLATAVVSGAALSVAKRVVKHRQVRCCVRAAAMGVRSCCYWWWC